MIASIFQPKSYLNIVIGEVFNMDLRANILRFRMGRHIHHFEIATKVVSFQLGAALKRNSDRHGDYFVCTGGLWRRSAYVQRARG